MNINENNDFSFKKEIKLFEAFAGIGAQHKALKNVAKIMNWKIKVVGIIEWFIPAICSYIEIHSKKTFFKPISEKEQQKILEKNFSLDSKKPVNSKRKSFIYSQYQEYIERSYKEFSNTFDISKTQYDEISKNIDIFTYSFPCQDLSNQGKQKGMNKNSGTKSSLLWEVERLLKDMNSNWNQKEMPKYLILENVPQIINKNNIKQLEKWIQVLEDLNYETKIYILNSSNFNSCQNRERAYCLSVRKDWKKEINFQFQNLEKIANKKIPLNKILDFNVDKKYFLPLLDKYSKTEFKLTKSNINKSRLINYTNFSSEAFIYDPNYNGPTLTASGANSRIKILTNNKIRRLSPKECSLYMGFSEKDYQNIKKTNLSETKITYLFGNSIVVNVLEEIYKTLRF